MKIGELVWTPDKSPSGTGQVEMISECGRYARVRKRYGKKSWVKSYAVKDLVGFGQTLRRNDAKTQELEV